MRATVSSRHRYEVNGLEVQLAYSWCTHHIDVVLWQVDVFFTASADSIIFTVVAAEMLGDTITNTSLCQ